MFVFYLDIKGMENCKTKKAGTEIMLFLLANSKC